MRVQLHLVRIKLDNMNKFIAYTTIWSEGVVVAHESDKRFAIGHNAVTGNIVYANSLAELKQTHSFELLEEFEDEGRVKELDTAFYPRIKQNVA